MTAAALVSHGILADHNAAVAEGYTHRRACGTPRRCSSKGATVKLQKKAMSKEFLAPRASRKPQLYSCRREGCVLRGRLDTSELQGGATLQLRKERALARLIPHTGVLQWGLDFSVTEGCNAVWRSAWHSSLQWGLDFSVAEGDRVLAPPQPAIRASIGPQLDSCGRYHASKKGGRHYTGLQWGRNLTVAEGSAGITCPLGQWKLQWGRNLTVAEGAAAQVRAARHGLASMGPQLDSCGRFTHDAVRRPALQLQWGRNLTVAEGYKVICRPAAMSTLQWGRNLTVAEGRR